MKSDEERGSKGEERGSRSEGFVESIEFVGFMGKAVLSFECWVLG